MVSVVFNYQYLMIFINIFKNFPGSSALPFLIPDQHLIFTGILWCGSGSARIRI